MNRRLCYLAHAIADDRGVLASPGAVLVESCPDDDSLRLLAAGSGQDVLGHAGAAGATQVALDRSVITPALVNAHTHLDLTHIGPLPRRSDEGFTEWIGRIRDIRATDPGEVRASVQRGVELSLRGGVAAVGDIAGAWSQTPLEVLRASPLRGVSYMECFGLGEQRAQESAERLEALLPGCEVERDGVRMGVQPHAPYSAGRALYAAAVGLARARGVALATHLAESRAERECIVGGAGPIRALLETLRLWDDSVAGEFGAASSPTEHLEDSLGEAPWTVAHVNDASDADIETLARAGASVVYCPRASAYFRHEEDFGPHRWRDMLDAGVNVALGTDSIVCLPSDEVERLSVLDEMRFLRRRDNAAPELLLGLATTCGAAALGMNRDLFRLTPGPIAGLTALTPREPPGGAPLDACMNGGTDACLLICEKSSRLTGMRGVGESIVNGERGAR